MFRARSDEWNKQTSKAIIIRQTTQFSAMYFLHHWADWSIWFGIIAGANGNWNKIKKAAEKIMGHSILEFNKQLRKNQATNAQRARKSDVKKTSLTQDTPQRRRKVWKTDETTRNILEKWRWHCLKRPSQTSEPHKAINTASAIDTIKNKHRCQKNK